MLALTLRTLPVTYREPLALGVRSTLLRPVLAMQRATLESDARFADPRLLRAERDSLAVVLVEQSTLAAENQQLRELLELRQQLPPSFVPAEVVRVRERGYDGVFLLTVGREDGVRPGAPIIAADGLVGTVLNVDAQFATGIDWTHPDFGASAMTPDGEVYGIVRSRSNLAGEHLLEFTGTALHTDLAEGTLIVTSGRGGVYPRGVPIGAVVRTEDAEGQEGWRNEYLLRPLVTPAEMKHVLVLGEPPQALSNQDLSVSWEIRLSEPAGTGVAQTALVGTGGTTARELAVPPPPPPPQASEGEDQGPRLLGTPIRRPPPDTGGDGR